MIDCFEYFVTVQNREKRKNVFSVMYMFELKSTLQFLS